MEVLIGGLGLAGVFNSELGWDDDSGSVRWGNAGWRRCWAAPAAVETERLA
jgi:hypothetical protein